jgi:hypothetical protein
VIVSRSEDGFSDEPGESQEADSEHEGSFGMEFAEEFETAPEESYEDVPILAEGPDRGPARTILLSIVLAVAGFALAIYLASQSQG